MATTSRKASRVQQKQRASARSGREADERAKRANVGAANGDGGAAPRKPVSAVKAAAAEKAGKGPKIVRDSFKMPEAEYALIGQLKKRCRAFGVDIKKSEVLRAGLLAMRELSDERLGEVVKPLTAARAERAARKRGKSAAPA